MPHTIDEKGVPFTPLRAPPIKSASREMLDPECSSLGGPRISCSLPKSLVISYPVPVRDPVRDRVTYFYGTQIRVMV